MSSWGATPVIGTRQTPGLPNTVDTPALINAAGTSLVVPTDNVRDLIAFVEVTNIGGSASIVFFLETSPDGKTWFPLAQTSPIVANGNAAVSAGLASTAGPFGFFCRLRWTISAGSATVYAFIQGR